MRKNIILIISIISFISLSGCLNFIKSGEKSSDNISSMEAVIAVTSNINITSSNTKIAADGNDEVLFKAEIFDKYQVLITPAICDYFVNDERVTTSQNGEYSFKSNTKGTYKIYAKKGSVTSNAIYIQCQ